MRLLVLGAALCSLLIGQAQHAIPGGRIFSFLDIGVGARHLAQASLPMLTADGAVDRMVRHPAALAWTTPQSLFVGATRYWVGSMYYHAAYTHQFQQVGRVGFFVNYIDYGEFEGMDERGRPTRLFRGGASEVAVVRAYRWRRWSVGGALKWVRTDLLFFKANAIMGDFSLGYLSSDSLLTFSLIYQNLGTVLRGGYALPGNLGWSVSYKFRHNPLRLYVGMHHLNVWRFSTYQERLPIQPVEDSIPSLPWREPLEIMFRHMAGGTEVILGQGLILRMGYYVQRRRETSLFGIRRLVGFSFGGSVLIGSLWVDYALVPAQPGNAWHAFALRMNLRRLIQRWHKEERKVRWN